MFFQGENIWRKRNDLHFKNVSWQPIHNAILGGFASYAMLNRHVTKFAFEKTPFIVHIDNLAT